MIWTVLKIIGVVVIVGAIVFGIGQCQAAKSCVRDLRSGVSGIDRVVTLYSCDGSIIGQWQGQIAVQTRDGIASFIDENNKRVILSGIYVIEEK